MAKNKLSLIQCFRGFAAILVLLVHATIAWRWKMDEDFFGNFFGFGGAGVDFFFVLSGFIITYVHLNDIGNPSKFKLFVAKRFLRIYPVYWVVNLIIIPLYFLFPSARDYVVDPIIIIKSLLLLPQENKPVVSVAWTLIHEIFFYSVFSFAILAKNNQLRKTILFGWLLITLVIFSMTNLGIEFSKENYFVFDYIFSSYNLEFVLGCLVGFLIKKKNDYINRYRHSILAIGTCSFLLFGFLESYDLLHFNRILIYGLSSMLIILGAALCDISSSIINHKIRLCLYLGDASYSIYLTHDKILSVLIRIVSSVQKKIGINNVGFNIFLAIMLVIGTTTISCIFYEFVEKKVSKIIKSKFEKRTDN